MALLNLLQKILSSSATMDFELRPHGRSFATGTGRQTLVLLNLLRKILSSFVTGQAQGGHGGIRYGYEKKAHIAWPGPGQSVRPGQHAAEFACGRHNVRPGNFVTAEHASIPGMASELGSVAPPLAIFEKF